MVETIRETNERNNGTKCLSIVQKQSSDVDQSTRPCDPLAHLVLLRSDGFQLWTSAIEGHTNFACTINLRDCCTSVDDLCSQVYYIIQEYNMKKVEKKEFHRSIQVNIEIIPQYISNLVFRTLNRQQILYINTYRM